jgi:pyridoxamine 5'-phosphate oxidase
MTRQQDPFARFGAVYERAKQSGIENPNAMALATVGEGSRPSVRMVLLKGFDERGFVFYTNLESRKGEQLAHHPHVALNFYWRELGEQVQIEGETEPVTSEEADGYFATRPRQSQLGAWASHQSRPMGSRARLVADVAKLEAKYLGRSIPRPPHWSGLRVMPVRFEFWVQKPFRLHERTLYERSGDDWLAATLYP